MRKETIICDRCGEDLTKANEYIEVTQPGEDLHFCDAICFIRNFDLEDRIYDFYTCKRE